MSKDERGSEFRTVGQLLGFAIEDGYKIKYLKVAVSEREYWIKPQKNVREEISATIKPGCWIEIAGRSKICEKTGKLKIKADEIRLTEKPGPTSVTQPAPSKAKASILVCQKSDCWKRGGKAVCEALEEMVYDRGLTEQVQVKRIGCMKECKKGPNVVMMPDKARYSNVRPQEIPTLLEKHFATSV